MSEELGKPGQIIDGKYRIVRLLGTGGMGAVYEGENLRIKRKVAIKMLHASVAGEADILARFEREAQAAALVGSQHICEVLDVGELPNQARYMVMEYLEGETLSALIKRHGRLSPEQSVPILLQVLEALGAAHAVGIIHRDLKPDNVFILPQLRGIPNFVKVLDFGVSKFTQSESMNVTRAGAVVGTPYYMSPEQARATGPIDHRADIYALGVVLYQASTGSVPFHANTFSELLLKVVLDTPPRPEAYAPDLPVDFAEIILKAMARDPNQRFASCAELAGELKRFQDPEGAEKTKPAWSERLGQSGVTGHGREATAAGFGAEAPSPAHAFAASGASAVLASTNDAGLVAGGGAQGLHSSSGDASRPVLAIAPFAPSSSNASGIGTTANAWGAASSASAGTPVRPRAGGRVVAAVLTSAVVVGGAFAVWMSSAMRGGARQAAPAGTSSPSIATSPSAKATPPAPPNGSSGAVVTTEPPSTSGVVVAPAPSVAPVDASASASAHVAHVEAPVPSAKVPVLASTGSVGGPVGGVARVPGPVPTKVKSVPTTDLGY